MSTDFFEPNALIRKVAAEPAVMLGAGRALLLQIAHPAVAQGVADFSQFQANPLKRLLGTMEATYAVVFGSKETAHGVGRRIQWIHERISGPTYRANDFDNLLWVHATLIETMLMYFNDLVRPLSLGEQQTVYDEATRIAELFGCPRQHQPSDIDTFQQYVAATTEALEIDDLSRSLAQDVLFPPLPNLISPLRTGLRPALSLFRLFAVGTLPLTLSEQLRLVWSDGDTKHLHTAQACAKSVFRLTPRPARIGPGWVQGRYLLWSAARHVAQFDEQTRLRN